MAEGEQRPEAERDRRSDQRVPRPGDRAGERQRDPAPGAQPERHHHCGRAGDRQQDVRLAGAPRVQREQEGPEQPSGRDAQESEPDLHRGLRLAEPAETYGEKREESAPEERQEPSPPKSLPPLAPTLPRDRA